MTCWWWIRHGPTHADGLIGWTDLPADLTDTSAISRLYDHLPEQAVVVSSDLKRCVATADKLAGTRQRLPHAAEIREIHFGEWEAKTFAEISKSDPDTALEYWSNPGKIAPKGGESWDQTGKRVEQFVSRINAEFAGQNIIAVAHFGVILTQLQRAGNMSATSALSFKIDNLSVTRLEFLDPEWRVHGVNHQP